MESLAVNLCLLAQAKLDLSTWVAYALATVAVLFVLIRPRLVKRRKDPLDRGAATTTSASLAQQRAVERQMTNLLVELSEMARTVSAGLDTRAAKLEALLDEADRRIAELREMAQHPGTGGDRAAHVPAPPGRITRADESDNATPAGERPEAPADVAVAETSSSRSRSNDLDPALARVYALADEGRSLQEIAATTGRPSGEIELILALRPREAGVA